jgi:hypothetical protein
MRPHIVYDPAEAPVMDARDRSLRDLRNITDGAAGQLLVQTTSDGSFLPVLRVNEVSYVGPPGSGAVMLVLADHDHFVIAYLTPLCRQELSATYPRRVLPDHFVRLVAWETVTRRHHHHDQPVVFVRRLVVYPAPSTRLIEPYDPPAGPPLDPAIYRAPQNE